MIHSLYLQNYRSWKKLTIDFSPGVNVIVGLSGTGKSNIIKALKWLYKNQTPTGNRHRSLWGGRTKARIRNDSHLISRIQGEGKNLYKLDGEGYDAVGRKPPPDDILKALNFSDVSLQTQAESFFLLNKTDGQVAKYLNGIVNLDVIDTTYQNQKRDLKRTEDKLNYISNELVGLLSEKDELDWVEEAEEELQPILALEIEIETLEDMYGILKSTLDNISDIKENLKRFEKYDEAKILFDKILSLQKEVDDLGEDHYYVDMTLEAIKKHKQKIKQLTTQEEDLQKIYDMEMKGSCPLCGRSD